MASSTKKRVKSKGRRKEPLRRKTNREATNLNDVPLWVLNADHDFLSRKLEVVRKRKEKGEPAHKKYRNYESKLKGRLADLEVEIERRKGNGKLAET